MIVALLGTLIFFVHFLHTNCFAPDLVTVQFPEVVALPLAVTVNIFALVRATTEYVPSDAEPLVKSIVIESFANN